MFGSQALETAIGLAFFFLAISVFVTGVQEFFATFFSLRAKTLASGITTLLSEEKQLTGAAQTIVAHPGVSPGPGANSYVSADGFAAAVVEVIAGAGAVDTQFQRLQAGIAALPEGRLKAALQTAASHAAENVTLFEQNLAKWFDDSMDRLAGEYKRLSGYISIGIGLALSGLFNLNALEVAKTLWVSEAVRQQAAAVAAAQVAHGMPTAPNADIDKMLAMFGFQVNNFTGSLGLVAIFGCLITTFAVSLGAPFWFDFLQNVVKMNVRGTGDKPARSDSTAT
ncbi:MAG TPA: hypothetical protein VIF60_15855 [Burkholderiaceae bacterium]